MLSPNDLLRVSEGGELIAETLYDEIIKKMVDRISTRLARGDNYILTAQDKWQLEVLQDSGYLREEIEQEIAKYTGLMQTEIAEAMEDAGVKAVKYDDAVYRAAGLDPGDITEAPYWRRLMQRNYQATVGEWVNFSRTTADACQQAFIAACDKTYSLVSSGAVSYSQAYVDALKDIVDGGAYVTYPSGHTDTIETAALRCIRTGVAQATAQITTARMEEMDWDIVLVSSHQGARVTGNKDHTDHVWWQGKFYSRSGTDKRFLPFSVCGEGLVQGICGANCRHSYGPGDGEFNPYEQYDSEENQKEYELQQRQGVLERRIRESKHRVKGMQEAVDSAATPEAKAAAQAEYDKQAALLQKRNEAYNEFCAANGLTKRNDRINIALWDRKQAARARGAAKRRIAEVGEAAATSNWHTIPVAGGQTETKYRKIGEPKDIDQNIALTNPGYKSGGPGYRQNCQRCVPAYEMRRRGYDVIAKPAIVDKDGKLSTKDRLYTSWNKIFKGAKLHHCWGKDGGLATITAKMNEWGEGAVAEVMVRWQNAEAHVFVVEHNGGKIRFVDPQTGNIDCSNYFTNAVNGATMIMRIDNLEPTDLIEECIKNRGGKP